ncbi:SRC kinase signaling inhibitor 1, partial [Ophiophagus hannah]
MNVPRSGITVDRDVKLECKIQNSTNANDSPPNSSPIISKPLLLSNGGGVSIPAMKMVNPASRLKQTQQGSPDKSKHIKQRMEYMRIQGQQQAARSTKDSGMGNETSSPVSEKPTSGRTSIPVLTSFGSRNSSISF